MDTGMGQHVVVIGAGIMGVCTAIELLRDGHRVTILDPGEPGGEQAASYGNAGCLSPGSVLPVAYPGMWRDVPGFLADPLGPLAIRWSYLPRLLPWLTRFVRAHATMDAVVRTARALRPLVADCPERHMRLAAEAGASDLLRRNGLLYAFPDRAAFAAEAAFWQIRHDVGVRWLELDADELRQREPALDRHYTFALLVEEGGHCIDPGALVAAYARHAETLGAERRRTGATGFRIEGGRLGAVRTEAGEIEADRAVIAAGARSRALAAEAGDRVFLESERGYHATIAAPEVSPRIPVMPSDGHMVYTPMAGGVRVAGQVELAGLTAPPNWRRAEILRRHARRTIPGLAANEVKVWMGHRPSTPDGVPCIGLGRCRDVAHVYGHGHIGFMTGPISGRLIADLVSEKPPVIDPAKYSPRRFA